MGHYHYLKVIESMH